ncbi:phosphatase PAP2 family protein [Actinoplanes sp. NPDC051861]|uniref:phosphatase PAP2 family protein n=1 Tax=Actinoplanes sp. NPDC051861 TaxID=3155170 RepID=UPI00342A68F7
MRPSRETTTTTEVRATAAVVAIPLLLVPFALIAALVAGRWGPLHDLDETVTHRLNEFALAHPGWVGVMDWWSLAFHPTTWRVAAAVLAVWLWRRRERAQAVFVVVAMTAGALLGVLLKLLFGRHRPDLLDPVAQAAGYAFPSGHALTNALGAAVFLMILLPMAGRWARVALWPAAVGIPLVTAFSRVLLGVHWTSDVVGGLLLGVALAVLARQIIERRRVPERPLG